MKIEDLEHCADCPYVIRYHEIGVPRRVRPEGECGHEKAARKNPAYPYVGVRPKIGFVEIEPIPDWCPLKKEN